MEKVKRFFELKQLWKTSSEAERYAVDREITELMDNMTEKEIEELTMGVQQDFVAIQQEIADIRTQLTIREQLEPVLPYLCVSKLTKQYFNKSSSWFYQRLNGNKIHGKVCRFTDKELETLNLALKDISQRIAKLQLL